MPDTERIERNRAAMRRFETCINTNDLALGEELISPSAVFTAPFSPVPLYGAKGYLSVVDFMRRSFPDVHWTLEDMVADEKTIAVQWRCTGTFSGPDSFAGLPPNNRKFSTTVMNFYTFDEAGRIIADVSAVGIAGILQGIGALPAVSCR
ncbi:ester cyclase [Victivallis sp.]|uniref:ester cyclase n=1 Tax=Victivallis sp. TaxID=2049020 RepID=UPI003A921465